MPTEGILAPVDYFWGMAQLISLSKERQLRRPLPVLCNRCGRRVMLSENFVASDGRPWKVYKCESCNSYEWKSAKPHIDHSVAIGRPMEGRTADEQARLSVA